MRTSPDAGELGLLRRQLRAQGTYGSQQAGAVAEEMLQGSGAARVRAPTRRPDIGRCAQRAPTRDQTSFIAATRRGRALRPVPVFRVASAPRWSSENGGRRILKVRGDALTRVTWDRRSCPARLAPAGTRSTRNPPIYLITASARSPALPATDSIGRARSAAFDRSPWRHPTCCIQGSRTSALPAKAQLLSSASALASSALDSAILPISR